MRLALRQSLLHVRRLSLRVRRQSSLHMVCFYGE